MAETKIPDIVETLYALLTVNWTAGNTNSRTPQVYRRQHMKSADDLSGGQDVIIIYDKASNILDEGIMHAHRTYEDNASIEIRCPDGPRQAKRMQAEVLRIIHGNHSSPTSYVEYNSSSDNTAGTWNYDLIELLGVNNIWTHDGLTRKAIEVVAWKYYYSNFT